MHSWLHCNQLLVEKSLLPQVSQPSFQPRLSASPWRRWPSPWRSWRSSPPTSARRSPFCGEQLLASAQSGIWPKYEPGAPGFSSLPRAWRWLSRWICSIGKIHQSYRSSKASSPKWYRKKASIHLRTLINCFEALVSCLIIPTFTVAHNNKWMLVIFSLVEQQHKRTI